MFDREVLIRIGEKLKARHESVAIAESVTGGLLQAAFSCVPEASLVYQGGMTLYNIGQKCRHLDIDPLHALSCNCVSQKISEELGCRVAFKFTATYGLGITGYAASMPEQGVAKAFAYYAITRQGLVLEQNTIVSGAAEGFSTQRFYAEILLQKFLICLDSSTSPA